MYSDVDVSIITPAYNCARFIGETIESVLRQDYSSWEMLIADDCSTDDTKAIVGSYAAREERVKLISLSRNGGAAAARNAALGAARGRYIAFLDGDDLWLPAKLRLQLEFMRQTGAGLSFTAYRRITQNAERCGRLIGVPGSMSYQGLLQNTAILTSTTIVDRSASGAFSMRSAYYDDFVLWLELLKRGVVARGLSSDLARYRVVARSISRNKTNSARQVWKTYRTIEGLRLIRSIWCFMHYAVRAWFKYRRF